MGSGLENLEIQYNEENILMLWGENRESAEWLPGVCNWGTSV